MVPGEVGDITGGDYSKGTVSWIFSHTEYLTPAFAGAVPRPSPSISHEHTLSFQVVA